MPTFLVPLMTPGQQKVAEDTCDLARFVTNLVIVVVRQWRCLLLPLTVPPRTRTQLCLPMGRSDPGLGSGPCNLTVLSSILQSGSLASMAILHMER